MSKKRKFNITFNDYTYPSLSKAIQTNKIELNNNFNSVMMQEKISKKSCKKKHVTNNNDMSNDITNGSSDNITVKTTNPNTKDKLGVTVLIAIMEPANESQSSRAYKQPLRSCPNNKIKVLLDSVSDEELYFLPKGEEIPLSLHD
jgi:hypothetical protein